MKMLAYAAPLFAIVAIVASVIVMSGCAVKSGLSQDPQTVDYGGSK